MYHKVKDKGMTLKLKKNKLNALILLKSVSTKKANQIFVLTK